MSTSNLAKISGFLPTDNISLTNSTGSLNGITNLQSGALIAPNTASVQTVTQTITAGKSAVVNTLGADVLDITGKTYSNLSSVIADLSSNKTGSTYITFGANISAGKHILVEYSATDGVHLAEITQGATSNHLAANSTGADLIDLVGIATHIPPGHLLIA